MSAESVDECAKSPQVILSQGMACRQTGRAVIQDIIMRHQRRIQYLETLMALLPEKMTGDEDLAVWNIATSLERP